MTGAHRSAISIMFSGLHRMVGNDVCEYVDRARRAEQLGFDEFLVADHVILGDDLEGYPYGSFAWRTPIRPDEPWPETMTLLAAVATATDRIRLGRVS